MSTMPPDNGDDASKPMGQLISRRTVFHDFHKLEVVRLRTRRHDGSLTPEYERNIFSNGESGKAVVVLPYDPVTDSVVLIEQFRIPVFLCEPERPCLIETPAGLMAETETPEGAAKRELQEECGLVAKRLLKFSEYYSSPGPMTEYIYAFIAEVETVTKGTLGGLEEEQEVIKSFVVSLDQAIAMADSGKVRNSNAVLAVNWLARNREKVRRDWQK